MGVDNDTQTDKEDGNDHHKYQERYVDRITGVHPTLPASMLRSSSPTASLEEEVELTP